MTRKKVSRREFIILSSLSVAGGLVSPWGGIRNVDAARRRGGYMCGMEDIIDPPPGDLLIDPPKMPDLSTKAGVVEVALEAKVAPVNINGKMANLLTYNGSYPAPTIRVNKGDLLKVRFKNSLPPTNETNILGFHKNITNLHTHGWHVSPAGRADNIFLHFEPGEEFLFEYDTSKQEAGTLSWYHPHVHGLVAEQLWGGLAGALVVEDASDMLSDYETHMLVLKDVTLQGSTPAPFTSSDYQKGKEGDIVMVNGQVNPILPIKPGQVQRWRIVNASTARYYKLALENHTMYLAGTDGNLLDQPYPLTEILLTPGERIDVLVQADQSPGTYRLLSLPYNRGGNTLQTVTLMTTSYEGDFIYDSIPSVINPDAETPDTDTSSLPQKRLALQMRMGRGLINGQDFEVDPYVITSQVGTYEVWKIVNMSMMDHPFHQHTNAALILQINGGDSNYASLYTSIPGWKDTINVPKMGGSVVMLVPVEDFTGATVFHCHIVEHEDIGMMGIWELE
jgi:FtsP/CotA-like multicopper oxidase with cupredoxin domain